MSIFAPCLGFPACEMEKGQESKQVSILAQPKVLAQEVLIISAPIKIGAKPPLDICRYPGLCGKSHRLRFRLRRNVVCCVAAGLLAKAGREMSGQRSPAGLAPPCAPAACALAPRDESGNLAFQ